MQYGELLLSKLIEEDQYEKITEYKLKTSDFLTSTEKEVFSFVKDYVLQNDRMPDYRTVLSIVPEFNYEPNVTDSYQFLVKQVKGYAAKFEVMKLLNEDAPREFEGKSGLEFIEWIGEELQVIKEKRQLGGKVGISLKDNTNTFREEYERRKDGTAFRVFASAFPSISEAIGGWQTGNMYTFYGRSGRGKSVVSMVEVLHAVLTTNCTVLVWSLEMSSYEWLARAFAYISATQGLIEAEIDGDKFDAGFRTNDMLFGKLPPEYEQLFIEFLNDMNKFIKGNIIIRGVNDKDWVDRSISQLESDIEQTKADICLIDPIYLMDMEANTSRTPGGELAATSRKLRQLAGRKDFALIGITQAEEVQREKDDDGNRHLTLPTRSEMKKSKSLLEDASTSIGFDSLNGRGLLGINKGRNGGENVEVEILFYPSVGLVREMDLSTLASSFEF